MSQTVIGIFENSDAAHQAGDALIENGFSDGSIEINDHIDTVDELVTDGQMTDTTEKGTFQDSPSVETDPEKNSSMVMVHVNYTGETLLATEILGDFGATDVNEFAEPQDSH